MMLAPGPESRALRSVVSRFFASNHVIVSFMFHLFPFTITSIFEP